MKNMIRNMRKTLPVLAMALILVLGSTVTAFADVVKQGTAGKQLEDATKNTFTQSMDVQSIYLDYTKLHETKAALNVKGDDLSSNGGEVRLKANTLSATGSRSFQGYSWDYVYPGAATYPDGSTADVTLHCELNTVYTASLTTKDNTGTLIPDTEDPMPYFDGTVKVWGASDTNNPSSTVSGDGKSRSVKVFVTATISVSSSSTGTYSSGTYVLPLTGDNAFKNNRNAWKAIYNYNPLGDNVRIRKEEVNPGSNVKVYMGTNCELMTYTDGALAGNVEDKSSVDDSYTYGFAIEGASSGTSLVFGLAGGYQGSPQGNNIRLQLGDLQKRIISGSGDGGSIATDKKGDTTGDELEGGTFPGSTFPTDTSSSALRRYTIPYAKMGVTYTMTPKTGYTLDKIKVDTTEFSVPENADLTPGKTWTVASSDGDGTLKYLGGGKFTYSFDKANTQDHEIYVTWKKGPTGEDKRTIGKKGETQKGTPTFEEGTGKIPSKSAYTLLDKDGKPVGSITVPGEGKYTINEDTGEVTFVPEPNFVGEAKGVTVQVTDDQGLTATAKYIPTVVDDPVWIDGSKVKTKDTVGKTQTGRLTYKLGGSPFASVHLIDPNTGEELPEGVTEVDVYQNGKKVGTYKLNPTPIYNEDGTVSFDIDFIPEGDYVGTPPPITVRVYNEEGNYADGVYQPEVLGAYENSSKKGVKTGDQTNVIIWVGILAAMAAVIAAILIRRRRRDG